MTATHVRLHYCDRMPFMLADLTEMLACDRTVWYDGPIEMAHENSDEFLCEEVFVQFNRGSGREHPEMDMIGLRSFSIGDVVEIVRPGNSSFWLCAEMGFTPIEGVRSKTIQEL